MCTFYSTYNAWFDHIGVSLLFVLPSRIIDALKCFGTFKSAIFIGVDKAFMALAFTWYARWIGRGPRPRTCFYLMNFP